MERIQVKRQTDTEILEEWIGAGSRVLDLGCGRGVLLERLRQRKGIYAVGVDLDLDKVVHCVKRGLSVYQGSIDEFLAEMPDGHFDWIICSRTVQELNHPAEVIREALRVGTRLAVGFANHAYWKNRLSVFLTGSRVTNEVFPLTWEKGAPYNPVSVLGFEAFCRKESIVVQRRVHLRGDWRTRCGFLPNWLAGYALYQLGREA